MLLPDFYSQVFIGVTTWTREKWKWLNHSRESLTSLIIVWIYSSSLQHHLCGAPPPWTPTGASGAFHDIVFLPTTPPLPSTFFSGYTYRLYLSHLCTPVFFKFPQPDSGQCTPHSVPLGTVMNHDGQVEGGSGGRNVIHLQSRHLSLVCVLPEEGCLFLPARERAISQVSCLWTVSTWRVYFYSLKIKTPAQRHCVFLI